MPTLPTFTVTDAVSQRLLAAFEGEFDLVTGQPITATQAYKRWLKAQLTQFVRMRESMKSAATDGLDAALQ